MSGVCYDKMTTLASCPFCSKSFKNVRLHIAKAHEMIKIEQDLSKVDVDDVPLVKVFYNNIRLEEQDFYDGEDGYTILFCYPDSLKLMMSDNGISVDFDGDHKVKEVNYFRFNPDSRCEKDGMFRITGKVAAHRVTVEQKEMAPVVAVHVVVAPVSMKIKIIGKDKNGGFLFVSA